jgi:hypothetical protein
MGKHVEKASAETHEAARWLRVGQRIVVTVAASVIARLLEGWFS